MLYNRGKKGSVKMHVLTIKTCTDDMIQFSFNDTDFEELIDLLSIIQSHSTEHLNYEIEFV